MTVLFKICFYYIFPNELFIIAHGKLNRNINDACLFHPSGVYMSLHTADNRQPLLLYCVLFTEDTATVEILTPSYYYLGLLLTQR